MDLLNLQSAVSPVSGTAASVGDCDDLEISFCDSVNYAVRKSPKKKFSRTVQVHRPSLGTVLDFIDGMIELGHKSKLPRRDFARNTTDKQPLPLRWRQDGA